MFDFFNKKYDSIVVPYKVRQKNSAVILEASAPYNGGFYCFHCALECNDDDLAFATYIKLNENILKEIKLNIRSHHVSKFNFDFTGLVDEEMLKKIRIVEVRLLKEGTI